MSATITAAAVAAWSVAPSVRPRTGVAVRPEPTYTEPTYTEPTFAGRKYLERTDPPGPEPVG